MSIEIRQLLKESGHVITVAKLSAMTFGHIRALFAGGSAAASAAAPATSAAAAAAVIIPVGMYTMRGWACHV